MRHPSLALRPKLEVLDDRLVPAVLFVDDDRRQRPGAGFTSIQAAVDTARPGDDIRVYPGTYREQVRVTTDDLTLESVGRGRAVIAPPAAGLSDTGVLLAVTDDADRVVVDGFTVTGGGAASGSLYAGIAVGFGASAVIRDNTVTDIRDQPLSGRQAGFGIVVQEADAVIAGNDVRRYQKGGIVAFGPGDVVIRGNTVVGAGPTDVIAQNGIQVSDGANALVVGNRVSGNVYTPAGTEASGIVVFQAGVVAVAVNRLDDNEVGVLALDQTAGLVVAGNRVSDSRLDGISLTNTRNAAVLDNRVDDSGRYGIALLGTTTRTLVAYNRVDDSKVFDLFAGPNTDDNLFKDNRFDKANFPTGGGSDDGDDDRDDDDRDDEGDDD